MSDTYVLSASKGADTAGIGWLLARAFDRAPNGIHLRSVVKKKNYISYPFDVSWSIAARVWDRADIVHVHNTMATWTMLGGNKPFVLHHHGTHYRRNADALNKAVADLGGRAVVATLDLLDYGDDAVWCPAPYSLDWLRSFRRHRTGNKLRVGHAPTNRDLKSTGTFLKACAMLDVKPVLIEKLPWMDCLAIKGSCDVLFDQVQLGYGHNAIEAWGMGIPVIAGGSDATLGRMVDKFGDLPFMEATETTIADAIERMKDDGVREFYSKWGMDHVRQWHSGRATVDVLTPIYKSLVGR